MRRLEHVVEASIDKDAILKPAVHDERRPGIEADAVPFRVLEVVGRQDDGPHSVAQPAVNGAAYGLRLFDEHRSKIEG